MSTARDHFLGLGLAINKAAHAYTDKHVGPREEFGNKGGSLLNRVCAVLNAYPSLGPVGRTAVAQTDAQMSAEILSYSRSRGVFAGVSVQGSTLRQDASDNRQIYGKNVTPEQILNGEVSPPASVQPLIDTLNKYSSVEHK